MCLCLWAARCAERRCRAVFEEKDVRMSEHDLVCVFAGMLTVRVELMVLV